MQWDTLQCRTDSSSVDVSVDRIAPDKWNVELILKDSGSLGHIRDRLDFSFLRKQEILPYHVTRRIEAQLLGPVQAEPSSLLFGVVHAGEKVQKTLRLINTQDDHAPVRIVSVSPSDPNHIETRILGDDAEGREISLVFHPDGKEGRYEGLIVIQAELDKLYRLHIAYIGYVAD